MKNPIAPSFKTEWSAVFLLILSIFTAFYLCPSFAAGLPIHFNEMGQPDYFLPGWLVSAIWPFFIFLVYTAFLTFPYLKINRQESARLKEEWHKSKDIAISFMYIAQVISSLILCGRDGALIWAMPLLLILLIFSFRPTFIKVIHGRRQAKPES
jgi:tryptophan-rich sensory protein